MIKLPGAVVVAGSRGKQPEAFSQRTEPPPDVGIMILMVDFDAIQPVITGEGLEHTRRKQLLAAATPGVGDHRNAARLVHKVDAMIYLDRVSVNVRWTAIGQEAVESFLPVAHMACLDQRIGDVRAANRRTVADFCHHSRFADRHTKLSQLREDSGKPTKPALADSCHLGGQAWTGRISAVGQDVHAAAVPRARELHSAYHTKTEPFSLRRCFIEAVKGVVIGQCDDIEPCVEGLAHQLSRRVRSIGD